MMNPEKRISPEGRSRRYFTELFEVKVSKTIEKTNRVCLAIVSNCFNIMETFLASNQGCRNENIPRKNENEYQR
jgi:hypothetical protein